MRDDCRMNGEIQGEIMKSGKVVCAGTVWSIAMIAMGSRKFSESRRQDVEQAGDKEKGKEIKQIKSTCHKSRCKCCRISTIGPLIHRPASNGYQKVHNLKQQLSRQNAA